MFRGSECAASPLEELTGTFEPFNEQTLASLYASEQDYLEKLAASISAALEAGFILPPDADKLRKEAPEAYRSAVAR
ncbi:alpha/beta hydrolase domain-containing protein [Glutamicibacter sp. TV12E]|uniref:alpha/beta hydrolase domain-containing protein n=1 Tax=Glutamicibacter sp. TV12E TaxID=3446362 RepID=UPI004033B30A